MAVDSCSARGLSVPVLPEEDQHEIKGRVSARVQGIASFRNPIDLTGSGRDDDFMATAEFLSRKEEVDCVLILLLPYVPGITSDLGARLSQVGRMSQRRQASGMISGP